MTQFAKLFNTPSGQLLVTTEFEDDEYKIAFRGEGNSVATPILACVFDTKEDREAAFASITQEHADRQAASIAGIVERMFGEAGHG